MVRLLWTLLACCTACSTPTMWVDAERTATSFYIDGRAGGRGPIERKIPYYGTVNVTTVPTTPLDERMRDARGQLEIAEPWSPWLFPIDFFLELGSTTLGDLPQSYDLRLEPEPRDIVPVNGIRPPRLEQLRLRAQQMAPQR